MQPIILPWHSIPKRAILLCGEARSGTTWLMERLCAGFRFRTVFEPLHPKHIQEASPFFDTPFLPPQENASRHKTLMDRILGGRLHTPWVNKYNTVRFDAHRLVKCIRANLALPWLQYHYPDTPIIFLIRHPIAVAHSKTRHGWGGPAFDTIFYSKALREALPELASISPPEDLFLKNILSWCIGHVIPLRMLDFGKANIALLHYEHAVCNPQAALKALLPLLPKGFCLASALRRSSTPSSTNANWSPTGNFEAALGSWKQSVSPGQLNKTLEWLHLFGLDSMYTEAVMPGEFPALRTAYKL